MKHFNYACGNPAYQDTSLGLNDKFAPPIYDKFIDEAYKIADKVELITPGRFLFNAGATPKAWNAKMLNDVHLKVLHYDANSSNIFPNQNITGGIAITYHDNAANYGPIEVFSQFPELNNIRSKVVKQMGEGSISDIAYSAYAYHFTKKLYIDNPSLVGAQSVGHDYDLKSNVFETLKAVFTESPCKDTDIKMLGRINSERAYRYIDREYISAPDNLHFYKVVLSGADGAAGTVGNPIPARVSGYPFVGKPGEGSTESFSSIGKFENEESATFLQKYLLTRFARCLLAVLKVTQNVTPEKWKFVPLQNFTTSSDIDWSKSVPEIDQQLYEKYDLSQDEIEFIENHIKEMN